MRTTDEELEEILNFYNALLTRNPELIEKTKLDLYTQEVIRRMTYKFRCVVYKAQDEIDKILGSERDISLQASKDWGKIERD